MATATGDSDLILVRTVKSRPSGGCALGLRCSITGGSAALAVRCGRSFFGAGSAAGAGSSCCGGGSSLFGGGSSRLGGASLVATDVPPPFPGLPPAVNALLDEP